MKKCVLIIIGLWFSVCLIYSLYSQMPYISGTSVYLKTTPVDPRDLIRGQYVNLNFEISRFEDYNISFNSRRKNGYVLLKTDENNFAHYDGFSFNKPKKGLFIKAELERSYNRDYKYSAKYNLESYFLPAKKARNLESELREGGVATVKIDKNGNAKIVEIKKSIF